MAGAAADLGGVPRVTLVEDQGSFDVFEVLGLAGGVLRVRTTFLFEIGEELRLALEQDGQRTEATARVRGHVGADGHEVTELELGDGDGASGA